MGKYPACKKLVNSLNLSPLEGHNGGGKTFSAVTYLCPHCQTILGAGLDPVAVGNDVGTRVLEGVHGASQRLERRLTRIEERVGHFRDRRYDASQPRGREG